VVFVGQQSRQLAFERTLEPRGIARLERHASQHQAIDVNREVS
jgi:hypothetical protein